MKKWMILLLVLLFVPACSYASYSYVTSSDEFGNYCSLFTDENGSSYSVFPETFPYSLHYEGKEIEINKAAFYQEKFGFGYHPFFHVQIDVSQLTEEEVYWLRNDDLFCSAFCQLDKIFDYKYFTLLIDLYYEDLKVIDMVYFSEDVSRYPLEGYDFSASMEIQHPKGSNITFESENVTIRNTCFTFKKTEHTPGTILSLDDYLLTSIQSALSK